MQVFFEHVLFFLLYLHLPRETQIFNFRKILFNNSLSKYLDFSHTGITFPVVMNEAY